MTTVAGGVYAERCIQPIWDEVFGSAGRAAAAIAGAVPEVRLITYRGSELQDGIENLEGVHDLKVEGPAVDGGILFEYMHSLSDPRITPRPDAIPTHDPIPVDDDVVLRFGMLEGSARVRAGRAVYDPQSAFDPRPFAENGSSAEELALILNRLEARRLTGETDPERMIDALAATHGAATVVLKLGGRGALVAGPQGRSIVPAYESEHVWKIGSGDVFSAAFALFWGVQGATATEATDLASRAVSRYVGSRALPIDAAGELASSDMVPVVPGSGRIYLAAPFFTIAERWVVEEIRQQLVGMGVEVFSPLHDVGLGGADVVAKADLAGLDGCAVVLAVMSGGDPGTIFEVGYAVSRGIPVVALAQNVRSEDLKMPAGSGCLVVDDLVTAIYRAVWSLP